MGIRRRRRRWRRRRVRKVLYNPLSRTTFGYGIVDIILNGIIKTGKSYLPEIVELGMTGCIGPC